MALNETGARPEGTDQLSAARSFTRMDSAEPTPPRRFNTAQGLTTSGMPVSKRTPFSSNSEAEESDDVFEKSSFMASGDENGDEEVEPPPTQPGSFPEQLDELPVELMSLTDRFVESLSAKVYDTPPSIDQLSDLFQDFYTRAASHISTHVSTLSSRLNRETAASPSADQTKPQPKRGFSSRSLQTYGKKGSITPVREQQMLTATEVAERKKARKSLHHQQRILEEAVERRACESVYDKIWRHRNALDEVRDEKLRSRTAAFSLVGITMKDLGVDLPTSNEGQPIDAVSLLAGARGNIMRMNAEKYPLGKLQNLTAAHKAMVDTLTGIFPSSSSADEILPTLIYTLITCPQDVNIISNMAFIQRFRASSKIDGEAAYCLTNLEAAISFLENVDMATLGIGDIQDNTNAPAKRELTVLDPLSMDSADMPPMAETAMPENPHDAMAHDVGRHTSASKSASNPSPQQRLSNLFQPPAKALGAANDIVRHTADQGIKNVGNTLDNSFNFLFGRLKEVQKSQGTKANNKMGFLPKTLDDARRLVNSTEQAEEDNNLAEYDGNDNSAINIGDSPGRKVDSRPTGPVSRKSDLDSTGSKLSADANNTRATKTEAEATEPPQAQSSSVLQSSSTAFDSVKSFGTNINPLHRIPDVIRGFGRNTPDHRSRGSSMSVPAAGERPKGAASSKSNNASDSPRRKAGPIPCPAPPMKKFVEMEDASELKLGDIPELLQDYKRLASALQSVEDS